MQNQVLNHIRKNWSKYIYGNLILKRGLHDKCTFLLLYSVENELKA